MKLSFSLIEIFMSSLRSGVGGLCCRKARTTFNKRVETELANVPSHHSLLTYQLGHQTRAVNCLLSLADSSGRLWTFGAARELSAELRQHNSARDCEATWWVRRLERRTETTTANCRRILSFSSSECTPTTCPCCRRVRRERESTILNQIWIYCWRMKIY